MYKNWYILFVTACLTLQLVASLPQRDGLKNLSNQYEYDEEVGDEEAEGESDINLSRAQLSCGTLNLLSNQTRSILRLSMPFLKDLVKELNSLPEKSAEIEKYLQRLTKALEGIDKIDLDDEPPQLADIFSSFDEVNAIFNDYAGMPQNEERSKLVKLFEKIGSKNLENKLNETLERTIKGFKKLFERYEESLSDDKGKQLDEKLSDWLERFKGEDDIEKKLDNLLQILRIL